MAENQPNKQKLNLQEPKYFSNTQSGGGGVGVGWGGGVKCTIKLRDVSLVGKMTFTEDQRIVMNSWVPHYAFMKLM